MKAGWEVRPLGELVRLNYGKAISRDVRAAEGPVPVYGANGVMDYCSEGLANGPSLIIGRKGSAGAINFASGTFWPSDVTYFTSHDSNRIDFSFLHYLLRFCDLPSLAKGVKPGINRDEVYAIDVSLPPLEEQKRIVAVLDEAFEGLARARANAEANLADTRELLDEHINQRLAELSGKYGLSALGEICDFRNGFAFKSEKFKPTGAPVVRISNIRAGAVDLEKVIYTDPRDYREDLARYLVQPGDLLLAMSGATTGKVGFNTTGMVLLQNQRVGRFVETESLSLRYLYHVLRTMVAHNLSISAGSAQPNLSTKQIEEIKLPIPSRDEQEIICDEIASLEGDIGVLIERSLNQRDELDALRQSLLQKAFSGELT